MAKILKIKFPEKCIGCELCVMEAQRQLNKVGLEDSPVRIFRNKEDAGILSETSFEIRLGDSINDLKLKQICEICPTGVFTIVDEEDESSKLLNTS